MRSSLAVLGLIASGASAEGDAAKGEGLFRQCSACHQMGADASHRVGPHLNDVFGRTAGGASDFRYSRGFTVAGEGGLVWDASTLDAFLASPRDLVPNTRMNYRGMSDAQDRADLIAFLQVFSDDPAAAASVGFAVSAEILSITGDRAYGEYLSSECTACHQANGGDSGIPAITGWPAADFVTAMHAYKDGAREHPVMQMMAGRLSNDEIAGLAAYFESVE